MKEYIQTFKNLNFVKFWVGSFISQLGDQFGVVAISWLVLQATDSSAMVGTVLAAYAIPMLITSFYAGVLLDRFSRKTLLIVDNGIRGVLYASIPLLYYIDFFNIALIIAIMLIAGALSTVSRVGSVSVIPNLVSGRGLDQANAFVQISWQIAYLLGPAIGGVLTGFMGAPATLLLNGVTFWVFTALLFTIDLNPFNSDGSGKENSKSQESFMVSFKKGMRFLSKNRNLLVMTGATLFFNLTYGPLEPALPAFVKDITDTGPQLLGFLWTSLSVAMIVGTLIWIKVNPEWNPVNVTSLIIFLWGLANIWFANTNDVTMALGAIFLAGFVFGPYNVVTTTYEQRSIPDHLRGRVLGLINSLTAAGLPLGQLLGGILVENVGVRLTILWAGIASLIVAFGIWLGRSIRLVD